MESKKYPNPPELRIVGYSSHECVYRKMWEKEAESDGVTVNELLANSEFVGIDEDGGEIEVPMDDVYAGMRALGCWGWVDTGNYVIHAWAENDADPLQIMHFLAHEIGHVTGTPDADDFEEEMRAEQYGYVAKLAYKLFVERGDQPHEVRDA